VAVHFPRVSDREFEASLEELGRLVTTLGYQVVARVTQPRSHLEAAAVLGEGKLLELAAITGGSGDASAVVPRKKDKARLAREESVEEDDEAPNELAIDLVAIDHDISPSQLRNLERATGTQVLDRTGVIIEIFHRHAKSREAKLQVEIARLTYTAPRPRCLSLPPGDSRSRGAV
jgi:GTPase